MAENPVPLLSLSNGLAAAPGAVPFPRQPGSSAEELLCNLLRDGAGRPGLPPPDRTLSAALLAAAAGHGVAPLLHERLRRAAGLPAELGADLRRYRFQSESVEMLRQPALAQLVAACAAADLDVLLMKGAALACRLYPSPGLRPRTDTDVLVRERDVPAVRDLLAGLGYELLDTGAASTLFYQFAAFRKLGNEHADVVDVHFRISNRLEFARLFDFDELHSRAQPLPELGHAARGLGLSDSLLIACLHRVGHLNEGEPERLIWLYDIHLLAGKIDGTMEQEFIDLMRAKRLTSVCNAGIARAAACFGTRIGPGLAAALESFGPGESASPLLDAGPLKTLWLQLHAQPGGRHRFRFVRELFLPPADYMRRKYPESRAPSWWLYVRRVVGGMRKRLNKR